MSQTVATEDKLASKIGFWAALLSALLVFGTTAAVIIGIVGRADTVLLQYTLWLALAPTLVVLMLCIHHSSISSGKKVLSGACLSFIVVYAVLISLNYFVQLTTIRLASVYGSIAGMDLFSLSMVNIHTVAWSLEVLSYGFQGLALLFIAPLFSGNRLKNAIRWLLIINGANGVFGLIAYPLDLNWLLFVSSFFLWSILFPVTSALLALNFRRTTS